MIGTNLYKNEVDSGEKWFNRPLKNAPIGNEGVLLMFGRFSSINLYNIK